MINSTYYIFKMHLIVLNINLSYETYIKITFFFQLGLDIKNIRRAAAPNDHSLFIDAIADIVSQHLRENKPVSPKFLLRCAHCTSDRCFQSKQWFSSVCKSV